jgi:hypothetical protein
MITALITHGSGFVLAEGVLVQFVHFLDEVIDPAK